MLLFCCQILLIRTNRYDNIVFCKRIVLWVTTLNIFINILKQKIMKLFVDPGFIKAGNGQRAALVGMLLAAAPAGALAFGKDELAYRRPVM